MDIRSLILCFLTICAVPIAAQTTTQLPVTKNIEISIGDHFKELMADYKKIDDPAELAVAYTLFNGLAETIQESDEPLETEEVIFHEGIKIFAEYLEARLNNDSQSETKAYNRFMQFCAENK